MTLYDPGLAYMYTRDTCITKYSEDYYAQSALDAIFADLLTFWRLSVICQLVLIL